MVNRDLLATKWVELAQRLAQVRKHRKATLDELQADRDAAELVAFNLMLAVQVCADVSSHLIADEGWPAPRSVGDGFSQLAERGIIPRHLAEALRRAVTFRNWIVHGYAGVDLSLLHGAASSGVDDLSEFARAVAGWASPASNDPV